MINPVGLFTVKPQHWLHGVSKCQKIKGTLVKDQYGITCDIVPIPFEFQKGSNKMLCLTH